MFQFFVGKRFKIIPKNARVSIFYQINCRKEAFNIQKVIFFKKNHFLIFSLVYCYCYEILQINAAIVWSSSRHLMIVRDDC